MLEYQLTNYIYIGGGNMKKNIIFIFIIISSILYCETKDITVTPPKTPVKKAIVSDDKQNINKEYKKISNIKNLTFYPHSLIFTPDSTRMMAGGIGSRASLFVYNTKNGEVLRAITTDSRIESLAISSDGLMLASGNGNSIVNIFETKNFDIVKGFSGHNSDVKSIVFSKDKKKLYSVSEDRNIALWDIKSGELIKIIEGHKQTINSIALSPDETRIATGSSDKTIKIWDANTLTLLKTFEWHTKDVNMVSFSPTGNSLLSCGDDGKILMWDIYSGEILKNFAGHISDVKGAVFTPDGKKIISASNDNSVKIWDIETREVLKKFDEEFEESLRTVNISKDGSKIAVVSDMAIIIYSYE